MVNTGVITTTSIKQ